MSARTEVIERLIATGRQRIQAAAAAAGLASARPSYDEYRFMIAAQGDLGPALWPYVSPWAEGVFGRPAAGRDVVIDVRVPGCVPLQARFVATGGPAEWDWKRAAFGEDDPSAVWHVVGVGFFDHLGEALARADMACRKTADEVPC